MNVCDNPRVPHVNITIDEAFKKKCPRAALGCVIAEVEAGETPAGLTEELKLRGEEILRLPEPRAVLETAQVLAVRAAL